MMYTYIYSLAERRKKTHNHCIANGVLNERLLKIAALALSTPQSSNKNIIVLFRAEYRKHRQPYFRFVRTRSGIYDKI